MFAAPPGRAPPSRSRCWDAIAFNDAMDQRALKPLCALTDFASLTAVSNCCKWRAILPAHLSGGSVVVAILSISSRITAAGMRCSRHLNEILSPHLSISHVWHLLCSSVLLFSVTSYILGTISITIANSDPYERDVKQVMAMKGFSRHLNFRP